MVRIKHAAAPPPPPEPSPEPATPPPDWAFGDSGQPAHLRVATGRRYRPLEWDPLPYMDQYLRRLESERKPRSYISLIKLGMSHFARYCHEHTDVKHVTDIERRHIVEFKEHLSTLTNRDGEPLSMAYILQLMKYVRLWIKWLVEEEVLEVSPWRNIRMGTVRKTPRPLEPEDVVALFEAHKKQAFVSDPFLYHRREVILTLLFAWGLRIHELVSIDVANVDMRLDYVRVRNKGGRWKAMPYGPELKAVIQRYLNHRAQTAASDESALLVDTLRGHRLSIQQCRKVIKTLGDRAGVVINPHRLRDTFGTTMLDHDVSVEHLMQMMGHRSRAQTLAYARINDHKVAESHQAVMGPVLTGLLAPKPADQEDR